MLEKKFTDANMSAQFYDAPISGPPLGQAFIMIAENYIDMT